MARKAKNDLDGAAARLAQDAAEAVGPGDLLRALRALNEYLEPFEHDELGFLTGWFGAAKAKAMIKSRLAVVAFNEFAEGIPQPPTPQEKGGAVIGTRSAHRVQLIREKYLEVSSEPRWCDQTKRMRALETRRRLRSKPAPEQAAGPGWPPSLRAVYQAVKDLP